MRTKLLVLIGLLLFIRLADAQTLDIKKLDSLMDALEIHNKAMGSLTISVDGKPVYARAIGSSDIAEKGAVPATVNSRYRIGSITKTFTSVMIFQLMEEKKLTGATLLKVYYPEVKNSDKITIDMLLQHRSGIYSLTDDSTYTEWMTREKSREELVRLISSYPSAFEPGTKSEYSNSNYVLLGFIIEKITGKTYAEVLKEKITVPAGLNSTYYGSFTDPAKNECFSFTYDRNWKKEPETHMSIPHGAGAIVSTSQDVVTFLNHVFSYKLLSRESVDRMTTINERYGMGIFQFPFGEKSAFGHTGGIDGFVSNAAYFPEDKLSFAFLSNGMNYSMNNIIKGVLSICFNKPYEIPEFGVTYTADENDLIKYPGTYSTSAMPLKLTVTYKDGALMAQGTGQPAFPLEAVKRHEFKFDPAGLRMEFHPDKNEMTLFQGAGTFLFVKE
jgi:CubicO group peptidase (beta-lactamase class C family)